MNGFAYLLAGAVLGATPVAEAPLVTLSARAEALCAAGGGCVVLTREQLDEFAAVALAVGVEAAAVECRKGKAVML